MNLSPSIPAVPSTPYPITVGFLLNIVGTDYLRAGLVFRQSSDGKLVYIGMGHAGAYKIECYKFNASTSYAGATYFTYNYVPSGGIYWLRIGDDGMNRTTEVSADGQNWLTIQTVGRTNFLTTDEIGLCVDANNSSFGTKVNFIHYLKS